MILGFLLRIKDFPNKTSWVHDIGRDFLAGYLIAFKDQHPRFGHWNSGLSMFYPPNYYEILAILFKSFGNYLNVIFFLIVLHSLAIIVLYKTAKNLFSERTALIASFFFSISHYAIMMSRTPLSAHLSIPLFITASYFFSKYFKKGQGFLYLFFCTAILIYTSTIFYGAILFVPFFALAILFNKNDKSKLKNFGYFLLFSVLFFLFFFKTQIELGYLKNLLFIKKNITNTSLPTLTNLQELYQQQIKRPFSSPWLFPTEIILSTFIFLSISRKKILKSSFLLVIIITMFLAMSFSSVALDHYLLLLVPVIYIFFANVIDLSFKYINKIFGYTLLLLILISMGLFSYTKHEWFWQGISPYQNLEYYLEENYPDYNVVLSNVVPPLTWDSRAIWFFQRNRKEFDVVSTPHIRLKTDSEKTLHICNYQVLDEEDFCKQLAEDFELKLLEKTKFGQIYFDIYLDPNNDTSITDRYKLSPELRRLAH